MTRRIRVLHIIQNLHYGGMERLLADIIRCTDTERFESHLLALEFLGRFADGLHEHAELHLAQPMSRWSMLRPTSFARDIRCIAPDVVHTHGGIWYKATLAARLADVPRTIHTEHGRQRPDPWNARLLDGLAARRTDVVVAVSETLARQLAATVVGDASRIRVVINGVDTCDYRPRADRGALRRELGLAPDVPIIGSIGRLQRIKGYDIMVEAFALLRGGWSSTPAPVLVLCGDGSERAMLEQLARERGVADAVHFLGWRDDIHELHSAFALFTMSSRSEGTSVSLLEAMSAGLCPIVTDVGGNAAVLGDALRHRLVPAERPEALAAAWSAALEQPAARCEDALRARARVEQAFGLEAMVRAYEALYAGGGS
ncbi:MAG TPA: glycosyltransferase [Gemmatimonadaceae bacterium]|nr:glycosyltransferase [Gemmatimonadaceae bacterium]